MTFWPKNGKHDEYYASISFARSVDALANAVRLHKGRTFLKSAANAVRILLLGLSVGCPEIHKRETYVTGVWLDKT